MILPKNVFINAPMWDELAYEAAHTTRPPVSIRKNPHKISNILFDHSIPWSSQGIYLAERPSFTLDPLFHSGAYYVQEASSMLVEKAFQQNINNYLAPIKVLDLCAAPGGKSTLLASLLNDDDLLISNEVIHNRASILVENMTRWGQLNTWVTHNDPKDFGQAEGFFDAMLVDAPCSGSGLWRKDENAINEWSMMHVKQCKERQQRILSDVLPALKKDGILIYATCSFSTEENEEILDWLVKDHNLESIPIILEEEWGIVVSQSSKTKAYGYRCYPWRVEGEGFFIAVFRKNEGLSNNQLWASSNKTKNDEKLEKQNLKVFQDYLNVDFSLLNYNNMNYALHPSHRTYWNGLKSNFHIKKAGTALGQILKDVVPEHDLALSIHLNKQLPSIELTHNEALHFLKKEAILTDKGYKGWHIAKFQNLALGWGKWMPNRMNNYLPKNHRIRMDVD